jgi:hypothetical protein
MKERSSTIGVYIRSMSLVLQYGRPIITESYQNYAYVGGNKSLVS